MALQKNNWRWAVGRFSTAAAVLVAGSGNWSVARNGAGDYTVTLSDPIDTLEQNVQVTCRTAGRCATVGAVTDTTIQILTTDLAVPGAADSDVDFAVERVAG